MYLVQRDGSKGGRVVVEIESQNSSLRTLVRGRNRSKSVHSLKGIRKGKVGQE